MSVQDEIKNLLEEQGKAFNDFKAENDKRLKEVEKFGNETATTRQNVETLNKRLDEIADAIKVANKAAADRADDIEKKLNRGALGGGGANADDAKHVATFNTHLSVLRKENVSLSAEDYRAYQDALDTFTRKGGATPASVMNTLQVGSDPDGGYWVTPDRTGKIVAKLYETSPMRQLADVATIGTDSVEGMIDNGQASSGWVGETDSTTRDTESGSAQVGMWKIPVHEQYAEPSITQKLLDDNMFDVEAWHNKKVVDKFARTENTAFVSGDGNRKPRGFLSYTAVTTTDATRAWGQIQYVPTTAAGAFASSNPGDQVYDLVYSLKAGYRAGASFLLARATVGAIRKFKDGQGRYLWEPSLQAGQPATLIGFPIAEGEDMPQIAANSLSVAFGNFKEAYLIVDRIGIRVLRDPYTKKGFVKMYTTKRTGGDVVNFEAIKLLKFAVS